MKKSVLIIFLALIWSSPSVSVDMTGFKKDSFQKKSDSPIFNPAFSPNEITPKDFFTKPIGMSPSQRTKDLNIDCNSPKIATLSDQAEADLIIMNAAGIKMECDSVIQRKEVMLTPEICLSMANCFKHRLDTKKLESIQLVRNIKRNAAIEGIALSSRKLLMEAMDFQTMLSFAEKEYGMDIIPSSCQKIKALESSQSCKVVDAIEQGYELAQKACNFPEVGCQKDYLKFIEENKFLKDENKVTRFLEKTSREKVSKLLKEQDENLESLVVIISSQQLQPDEKVERIKKFLKTNRSSIDPVFNNYLDRLEQEIIAKQGNTVHESLKNLIIQVGKKPTSEIRETLSALKKNETRKLLEKKCENSMTMTKFCNVANELLAGAEIQVETDALRRLLNYSAKNFSVGREQDYKLGLDVARCNIFNHSTNTGELGFKNISLSGGRDFLALGGFDQLNSSLDEKTLSLVPADVKKNKSSVFISTTGEVKHREEEFYVGYQKNREREKKEDKSKLHELALIENFSKDNSGVEIAKKDGIKNQLFEGGLENKVKNDFMNEIAKKPGGKSSNLNLPENQAPFSQKLIGNYSNSADFNSGNSLPVDSLIRGQNDKANEAKAIDNSADSYQTLRKKIAELEKQIAEGQKIQKDQRTDLSDKEGSGLKVDDENSSEKNSLLKELKSAKESLAVANEKKKKNQESSRPSSDDETFVESPADKKSPSSSEDRPNALVSPVASQSSTGRGVASSSSISASATSSRPEVNSEEIGQASATSRSSLGDGEKSAMVSGNSEMLVLAKIDGGGTKSNQIIKDLIFREGGKAFLIEEDGLVKEIIPEFIDGKIALDENKLPIFKTVIKGKVAELKKAPTKSANVSKVESLADLRKLEQEDKKPSVRYLELRKTLDGISNKKSK